MANKSKTKEKIIPTDSYIEEKIEWIKKIISDPKMELGQKRFMLIFFLLSSDDAKFEPTADQNLEVLKILYVMFGDSFEEAIDSLIAKL